MHEKQCRIVMTRKFVEKINFLRYTDEFEHDMFAELDKGTQYAHVLVLTSLDTYKFIESYQTYSMNLCQSMMKS